MKNTSAGTLYIVATPIGNLEDITLRALRVLKEADTILCEDTRHTKKLLSHYDIHAKTESFHVHSDEGKLKRIAALLKEGKDLALVSDAGTPLVSDPGSPLLMYLRKELGDDAKILSVPGASALTAALSLIPVPGGRFTFLGFLPHKKGRKTAVEEMAKREEATVLYESSHRIVKLLSELEAAFPEGEVWIARELTKQFEEVLHGAPAELKTLLEADPQKQKGEFVVAVWK